MTGYIVDASVAAKWFLPASEEPFSASAHSLVREFLAGRLKLEVPDLFWSETANILWKSVRRNQIPATSIPDVLASLRELRLPTIATYPLLDPALDIAMRFDRSVYDAIYVALAARQGIPLLTADQRLVNALAPHNFPICWLGSL